MAVAIGRDNQATSNQNYCQPGIMATADDATWGEISGFKRSVTFYKREAGQWCYYCQVLSLWLAVLTRAILTMATGVSPASSR